MGNFGKSALRRRGTRFGLAIIAGLCALAAAFYLRRSPNRDQYVSVAEIVRAINAGEVDSLALKDGAIVVVTRSSQRLIAAKELRSDGVNLLINVGTDRARLSAIRDVRYIPESVWGRTSDRFIDTAAFLLPIVVIIGLVRYRAVQAKKPKKIVLPTAAPEVSPAAAPAPLEDQNVPAPPAATSEAIPSELPGSTPNVRWDDIAGLDDVKLALQSCAHLLKNPASLISIGGVPRRGFLLVGPRGTGKSILAAALATELDARVFRTLGSLYFGCSDVTGAGSIREIFANARSVPRAVVLIDELDALGKRRSNNWSGPNGAINQLIAEFDGFGNDTNPLSSARLSDATRSMRHF